MTTATDYPIWKSKSISIAVKDKDIEYTYAVVEDVLLE